MKQAFSYQMPGKWRRPEILLFLMAIAVPLSMSTWMALINNFVIEQAQFNGEKVGVLHSLREVPGFLAFTAVFVLLILKEQDKKKKLTQVIGS